MSRAMSCFLPCPALLTALWDPSRERRRGGERSRSCSDTMRAAVGSSRAPAALTASQVTRRATSPVRRLPLIRLLAPASPAPSLRPCPTTWSAQSAWSRFAPTPPCTGCIVATVRLCLVRDHAPLTPLPALHLACLTGLVKHSVSCPQCRASLLPPELEHLAPAFTPAGARTWATQEGFHPAAGGVITADDFDLDSEDDLEDLQSGPLTVAELGRRWEARHRRAASLNGLSVDDHLLLTMRLRRQHFPLTVRGGGLACLQLRPHLLPSAPFVPRSAW